MLYGLGWNAFVLAVMGVVVTAACAKDPVRTQPTARIAVPTPQSTAPAETAPTEEPTPTPEGQGIPRISGGDAPGTDVRSTPPTGERRPAPGEFREVRELRDVLFDFDGYEIRGEAERVMASNLEWMRANGTALILIEGHCDERGTPEYNLALGQRRAQAARNYLVARGVSGERITLISYGKERPACSESSENCWARNRRAHFAAKPR
jgi:peptidoglycan-associated lipoprotein